MKKFIIGAALALALPLASFAATFTNVQFSNGDVTISGQGGSTVQATFHVIVPAGQVVEYVQTDVVGDNLAPVDVSVGGELGLQEGTYDVPVSVKLPPNTGTYTLNVQGAGIYGGVRSISGNDNVVGTASFSSSIRVVAGGEVSGSTSTSLQAQINQLAAQIAALVAAMTPTTPAAGSACAEYSSLKLGLSVGSDTRPGGSVGRFQSFLMYKGYDIPLLSSNQAPYGYFGVQTNSASMSFASANHCN